MTDPKSPEDSAEPKPPELAVVQGSAADDDDEEPEFLLPRRRGPFPPSVLLFFAGALAFLSLEPTADLGYTLFGPSVSIDLGRPGDFHLDRLADGARVKIGGFASGRRGSYSSFPFDYEALALVGTSTLVERAPEPPAPPSSVELFEGEGRVFKLDDHPVSFAERLVRPAARYDTLRETFTKIGELPAGRTAWLLRLGDVPRGRAWPLLVPAVEWLLVALLVFLAVREWIRRNAD